MSKIIITGASGFVGRHLIPTLEEQGHTVYALNSSDFTDIWLLNDIDYIIHLAVKTAAGGYCQNHPGEQYLINSQILIPTILKCLERTINHNAKMVTFGSSCGYDKNVMLKLKIIILKGET
jgi:nucleoside-diphosphate-sugar epimerase